MTEISNIGELPNLPAIYAMYGGKARSRYVAYVGMADNLRRRVTQHLVNRDSSVTTGTTAASLNPDYVTEVRWWEHPDFVERNVLQAAELVAFDVLNPALRSRGSTMNTAKDLYADKQFYERFTSTFESIGSGRLLILDLDSVHERLVSVERRVQILEELARRDSTTSDEG